ncbi:MAG: AIPR family protein [Clostridiales bacterium]|jgi:hypothetical protein|nr:AIPR family protein [Eubacteriales bacterium]MDH7566816.1 AIPR family protein [Clostridiales bacterium]
MRNLSNNQVLLEEYIDQEFKENESYNNIDQFFEFFVAGQVLKNYDLSDEEIESGIIGASLDGGCDGIYIFVNGILINKDDYESSTLPKDIKIDMFILQAKNSTSFNEDVIMKWKTTSDNLLQMSNSISDFIGRYNEDVLTSFQLFRDLYIKAIRKDLKLSINYLYISKGIDIHQNVSLQAKELEKNVKKLFPNPNSNVIVKFIGADMLMELISTPKKRKYNLPLIENPITVGSGKDYIALVNLVEYYKFIIDENGFIVKNIFESNVRDYQGNTNVNNEIHETLVNETLEDFWWLNNGITILASEVIPITAKMLVITDPEIVNGLQTSTEIYNYFSCNPNRINSEKRNVLVRIIVPETEESRDKIILATNSQTTIPKSSLRATDTIHRQIEMFFKSRGLYYDRRKNYYKNQGKKSSDIISISFLAQCLIAILLQMPDYARARPSTLLTDDEYYKKLYIDNNNLTVFYNIAVIGKQVEKCLKLLTEYSKVERGDILFYVMYKVVSDVIGKKIISANDIKDLDTSLIDYELIKQTASDIYKIYKELGGNSRVAKGVDLINHLKQPTDK